MSYNYYEAIKEDIKQAIEESINLDEYRGDREALEEKLNDDLWIDDSVTGNASGSYTFNSYTAKKYVQDNLDLLKEAAEEFGCTDRAANWLFDEAWEDADVTIRCYLLGRTIAEVLDEIEAAGDLDEIEEEPSESLINLASQYIAADPEPVKAAETINA